MTVSISSAMRVCRTWRPFSCVISTTCAPFSSVRPAYAGSQYANESASAFEVSALLYSVFSRLFPALGFFSPFACEHHM